MPEPLKRILADEDATLRAGGALARALPPGNGLVMFLRGELGAGKTTLVRGMLRELGHRGRVPSPTYTLIEPYLLGERQILHVDLYRLESPAEVTELGIADLLGAGTVLLVEWPERGAAQLPAPDLEIILTIPEAGRALEVRARTTSGAGALGRLDSGLL